MDMGKYVAVGVLAVVVLAAVTYEAPEKTLRKDASAATAEDTFEGTFGQAPPPPEEPELAPLPSTAPIPAPSGTRVEPAPTVQPSNTVEESAVQIAKYTVKAGQTLCDVAQELLGDRNRWKEVYEQNKDRLPNPDQVKEGMTLVYDAAKAGAKAAGAKVTAPAATRPDGRTYRVAKGDTLYAIASRELGRGNRWQEIATLNGLPSERVTEGTVLRLPAN